MLFFNRRGCEDTQQQQQQAPSTILQTKGGPREMGAEPRNTEQLDCSPQQQFSDSALQG